MDLPIGLIRWPEDRVTAYYREDEEEVLEANLRAMGQQQPIVVIQVVETYYGTDGYHRWKMAKGRGEGTIPCTVRQGTIQDVLLSNLVLNSLRGRTKPSEQVAVIEQLFDLHEMDAADLAHRTGMSRDRIDMMLLVAKAPPAVRDALDQDLIALGHAHVIARVEDTRIQEDALRLQLVHRWTVKELESWIAAQFNPLQSEARAKAPAGRNAGACSFCHEEKEEVTTVNACAECLEKTVENARTPSQEMFEVLEELTDWSEQLPDHPGGVVSRARDLLGDHARRAEGGRS